MAIPPDPDFSELTINRAHLQTFTWLHCCEQKLQNLDPEEFMWKLTDDKLLPLWFNANQFPPLITRRKQGKKTDGNDADSKTNDPEDGPPKKKPQAQRTVY